MRHSMKPDLRADYKIRLYTGPKNPFFEVSTLSAWIDTAVNLGEAYCTPRNRIVHNR